MAKSTTTRQKYNFLIAFCRQLEEAADEGDEEYAEFRRTAESLFPTGGAELEELATRVGKIEQWNAQLETAVDSLEQAYSALDGEDADIADDSDEDPDLEGDGPQVERGRERTDSVRRPVAGARSNVALRTKVTRG